MKTFKILTCALAVAAAFAAGSAGAKSLILNVSGTVKYQNVSDEYKGSVSSHSFNEKSVYNIISNAVANASSYSDGAIESETLPANGYIVFNPDGYDDMVEGTFYVTNSSGFYYPLSGYDRDDDYYSWIELDTDIFYGDDYSSFYFGFYYFNDYLFNDIASYNINTTSGSGSDTSTSKALLYIHDSPYDYGDPNGNDYDDFYPFDDENENALEIGGILTTSLTFKDYDISSGNLSLSGSGNFIYEDYDVYGVVSSGHASIAP